MPRPARNFEIVDCRGCGAKDVPQAYWRTVVEEGVEVADEWQHTCGTVNRVERVSR
jgi:hypothetical protein